MKLKRILAISLAALMIVALVGCGGKKRERIALTLSTEDSEAILNAAGIYLPDAETAPGANSVVKWYANYDFYQYSEGELANLGFFTFKERYGGDSEWIEYPSWEERYTQLANLVLAGTSPDFMPGVPDLFPNKALKGMIQPVNDYIDYSDPLWGPMKDYAEKYFSIGDKVYIIAYDMSCNLVCPYNPRVIEEWGFDDPAELYANDEWTWDRFADMCYEFTDGDQDRYALDGWYFSRAIMRSAGISTVSLDSTTGKFVSNLDDPRLERAAAVLYDLNKAETIYPWWNGWQLRNGTDGGGMKEGTCLFQPIGMWGFTSGDYESVSAVWGDTKNGEIMFVPIPRDPNGDGIYYMDAQPSGYAIIAGATNPEGVGLLAMCDRFKTIDPTVENINRLQYKTKFFWTDEMLEMWDECYELANADPDHVIIAYADDSNGGLGNSIGTRITTIDDNAHSTSAAGAQTWAQIKESQGDALQYDIDELNQQIDDFIANGYTALPSE